MKLIVLLFHAHVNTLNTVIVIENQKFQSQYRNRFNRTQVSKFRQRDIWYLLSKIQKFAFELFDLGSSYPIKVTKRPGAWWRRQAGGVRSHTWCLVCAVRTTNELESSNSLAQRLQISLISLLQFASCLN